MSDFRFASPLWFALAPAVVGLVYLAIRRQRRQAVTYSSTTLVARLPHTWRLRLQRALPWLYALGLVLVLVALARPQWGLSEFRVQTDGIAIVMCLDRSGSMNAMDFELQGDPVTRITAVKHVFRRFVAGDERLAGRQNDTIGLIAFGGFAEARTPLTLDHDALNEVLETVEIARPIYDAKGRLVNQRLLEVEQATAIGDAVALGVDRLKASPSKSKVLILLSDGENTAGLVSPNQAAEAAAQFGVKIYAIGVGTTGAAPFREQRGNREVVIRRLVRLDEATLRSMADTTGGAYFNARDVQGLQSIYARIDALEKTEIEGQTFTRYRELYRWAVWPSLALLAVVSILQSTWLQTIP